MREDVIRLEGIHPYSIWVKTCQILKFAFFNRFYLVVILILTAVLLKFSGSQIGSLQNNFVADIKGNNTSTIFNLVSLIFIFALSIANIIREWKETRPKYLSVKFFCGDQELPQLADRYALLISEADIRSLAQQIGQQKNSNIRLDLDSTNYNFEKTLSYDRKGKVTCSPFWHYEVTVSLRKPPAAGKQYMSKEEYFDNIHRNLAALLEKTEKDYETTAIKEIKATLSELINSPQTGTKEQ